MFRILYFGAEQNYVSICFTRLNLNKWWRQIDMMKSIWWKFSIFFWVPPSPPSLGDGRKLLYGYAARTACVTYKINIRTDFRSQTWLKNGCHQSWKCFDCSEGHQCLPRMVCLCCWIQTVRWDFFVHPTFRFAVLKITWKQEEQPNHHCFKKWS